MNLTARPASHTASQPASRLTGIGLAIGIHAVLILGFASAFVMPKHTDPLPPPTVQVLKDPPPKQPEPTPVHADPVQPRDPVVTLIQPDENLVIKDNTVVAVPNDVPRTPSPGPTVALNTRPTEGAPAGPAPIPKAGAVCTRMTSPEMPNVNFAGEAMFRAVATTHGGRVTGIEIQALSGGIDNRSLRAFKGAIERALGSYECPGDVRFTQEFNFRLE